MSVDIEPEWQPATKLNVIGGALDFTALDPLPENVTRDQIEEICYTIRELYGDYVDEIVAETTLSQREAQTWVLRTLAHDGTEPLSYEAIGLYIWAIGRATDGDPLSRTIVTDYYDRAETKIERAEATVKRTGPPPYPDDVYDDPAMLWVDTPVAERLQRHRRPNETFSDCLSRLLDEAVSAVPLAAFVEAYRTERDADYVAVDTVYPDWDAELRVVVGVPANGTKPDAVTDAAALRVDGQSYDFTVSEASDPVHADSHLVVYAETDDISVAIADGTDRLETALAGVERSLPDLVSHLRSVGATGLAIGTEPAGAGAHLFPVFETEPNDEPLAALERLPLDERTLDVGRVSPVTVAAYREHSETTKLLWARNDGPFEPKALPDDGADRRELIPDNVLRTST
ncbi:hypothetical protein Harman_32390 [Haloarcula mannanilytica]|uniref:Uncharacterized protein n=1 Tax=Haloarcula mannanilytica TaxID=2509225 RepID=A0A4C2EL84_9EURY|nr:hypothetical protein [Haloarcula mannanilytica]GCF15304.1 hypothetical protein Harman_32390 [Haloarcula mannanilytica]